MAVSRRQILTGGATAGVGLSVAGPWRTEGPRAPFRHERPR